MASYIVHSGVKGRSGKKGAGLYYRYGELTEEGKRHYYGDAQRKNGKKREELKSLIRRSKSGSTEESTKKEKPESSTWKSKDASKLSDAELNRRNSRLQREKQYREMTQTKGQKAAKWIKRTASAILVASAVEALKNHMQNKVYRDVINNCTKQNVASIAAAAMINIGSRRKS